MHLEKTENLQIIYFFHEKKYPILDVIVKVSTIKQKCFYFFFSKV